MVVFYKIWKKYNDIQLTKKIDLNNRKMTNHPPSPDKYVLTKMIILLTNCEQHTQTLLVITVSNYRFTTIVLL